MGITENIRATFSDREFLKKAFMLAFPVAMQNMLNTIINLVDTMMIGKLGSVSIAAVGLANKYYFVFNLFIFGICSGGSVLAAQYWGGNDRKSIRKVMGFSMLLAFLGACVFFIPALLFPGVVMSIFTNSEASVEVGMRYLRIACLTYPLLALSNVIVSMLRAVNRVKIPVITSSLAIGINVFFYFFLIFGNFGFL